MSAAEDAIYTDMSKLLGVPRLRDVTTAAATKRVKPTIHVFVDCSNIAIGCKSFVPSSRLFPPSMQPGDRDQTIQLDIPALCDWMERDRPCEQREAVGTMSDDVAGYWRRSRYDVTRTTSDKTGHADEILHAHVFQSLLERDPATLVLATGDGNTNGETGATSAFPRVVAGALRQGWLVELVCWSSSLSRVYRALQALCPQRMTIRFLDEVHDTVCFRGRDQRDYHGGGK